MRCLIKVSWWCAPMACFTDSFFVILMKPKSNTLNIMSMGCLMGVDILKTKWRYPKFPDVTYIFRRMTERPEWLMTGVTLLMTY